MGGLVSHPIWEGRKADHPSAEVPLRAVGRESERLECQKEQTQVATALAGQSWDAISAEARKSPPIPAFENEPRPQRLPESACPSYRDRWKEGRQRGSRSCVDPISSVTTGR